MTTKVKNIPVESRRFSEKLLNNNISLHLFFWVSLYIILVVLDNAGNLIFVLQKEFINVIFFAAMVYINTYILFPTYLTQKKLLGHILSLAIIAILITPIKTLFLFWLAHNIGSYQEYILQHKFEFFLSTFFIGIASTIFNIMNDWLEGQRVKKELVNQNLQSELKFLKSQINPHFLFNTLNSLYALTLKKSEIAPEIVLKLSEIMRYMLYECNEKEVPLSKEINYIKNYLELERLRQGKEMVIDFNLTGKPENHLIAPMIFIPFIENAFKHGLNKQLKGGFVIINMTINDDTVVFDIENNISVPIDHKSLANNQGGIGLSNVKRRLKLLYPKRHKLIIRENQEKYKVSLTIHL